jgi:hypothetical protein
MNARQAKTFRRYAKHYTADKEWCVYDKHHAGAVNAHKLGQDGNPVVIASVDKYQYILNKDCGRKMYKAFKKVYKGVNACAT